MYGIFATVELAVPYDASDPEMDLAVALVGGGLASGGIGSVWSSKLHNVHGYCWTRGASQESGLKAPAVFHAGRGTRVM